MTEHELREFINDKFAVLQNYDDGDELYFCYEALGSFRDLLGDDIFKDIDINVALGNGYICIQMNDIYNYFKIKGINNERISID